LVRELRAALGALPQAREHDVLDELRRRRQRRRDAAGMTNLPAQHEDGAPQ
jgi:hypothetical protein